MTKTRIHGPLAFDGATISLLPDLSNHTLVQQRALKPLLNLPRDCRISYRWGFPFHLQIGKEGRLVIICQCVTMITKVTIIM